MKPRRVESKTGGTCRAAARARAKHKALLDAWRKIRTLKKRLEAKEEQVAELKLKLLIAKPLLRVAKRQVRW